MQFISACQHECGGISASIGHDPHILYTLSAVQILTIYDAIDKNIVNTNKIVSYIKSLQQPDGSFYGDKWGEVDVRFSFGAIATLSLLGRLNELNLESAINFVMECYNMCDGGFGSRPGSESHAGLIYCSLGSLAIAGELHRIDADQLGWWLAERQLPSGGLNGRPEKLPDLCYSWWVLSSLQILGRLHWINKQKLVRYILACQDQETGGFSDRPGNLVDPFHTLFGIAGLSLLTQEHDDHGSGDGIDDEQNSNEHEEIESLESISKAIKNINPVFCMAQNVIDRCNIKLQLLSL